MMFSVVFPEWINIFWVLCIFILECSWECFILFQFCCGEIFKKIHVSFFVSVLEMSLHFFYCSKKNQTSGFYSYTKTYYFIDITYSLILTILLDYYLYRLKQTGYITANHTSSMQNNGIDSILKCQVQRSFYHTKVTNQDEVNFLLGCCLKSLNWLVILQINICLSSLHFNAACPFPDSNEDNIEPQSIENPFQLNFLVNTDAS